MTATAQTLRADSYQGPHTDGPARCGCGLTHPAPGSVLHPEHPLLAALTRARAIQARALALVQARQAEPPGPRHLHAIAVAQAAVSATLVASERWVAASRQVYQ